MPRIIAFLNQKGGVAKTTSTVNIGAALTNAGKNVLLIDLDPQGHLTISLNIQAHELVCTINEVLAGDCTMQQALIDIEGGCHVVSSDIRLSGAESELNSQPGREMILKEALQPIKDNYDYILIDCPPSLGLLTLNALTATHEIFIPLQTEYLALHGMAQLIRTTEKVKSRINPSLEITGIIATFYDKRKKLNREVVKKIEGYFPDKVFKTKIRNNVALSEAQSFGIDVFHYKPRSNGAADYKALCKEIIKQESETDER